MRIICNESDIQVGLAALASLDPRLVPVIEAAGPVPLRLAEAGFAGLAFIIVSQVVSKASAAAIWNRIRAAGPITAETYLGHQPEMIASFGLSRAKAATLAHVARAVANGEVNLEEVARMEPFAAMAKLTALHGVGPWTAEVYLMFCGGHPDIFPVGDVALRISVGDVFFAGERPAPDVVAELAQAWAPVRSVAARLFWAHYARITGRVALPR